jgi:putative DNA primase/helicase
VKTLHNVQLDEDATYPKINAFLKSVVAEQDIILLHEIASHCLATYCSFQKAFMLQGSGSNGKSVSLALLGSLVGRENISSESLHKLEKDNYRTTKLYRQRVDICCDIPDYKIALKYTIENLDKLNWLVDLYF